MARPIFCHPKPRLDRRGRSSAERSPRVLVRNVNVVWLFRVLSGRRSQIEFPTVEVDGVDEVLLIAETARAVALTH